MSSEKENTVSQTRTIVKLNITPPKKAVTLSIGSTFLFPRYLGRSKGLYSQGILDLAKKNF